MEEEAQEEAEAGHHLDFLNVVPCVSVQLLVGFGQYSIL